MRRAKRAWVWALGVFGGVAFVFGLLVWDIGRKTEAALARHAKEVAEKIAAIRARDPARMSAFGGTRPGNAWGLYTKAVSALNEILHAELGDFPKSDPDPLDVPDNTARIAAMALRVAPHLELLRQAMETPVVDPGYAYEEGSEMRLGPAAHADRVAQLIAALAMNHHREGRDREALDLVLLGIGLGQDLARRGPLGVRDWMEAMGIGSCRRVLAEHSLRATELEGFARTLDRLEVARSPMVEALEVEDVTSRQGLLSMIRENRECSLWDRPTWRHLFSRRLAQVAALNESASKYRRAAEVAGWPVHEHRACPESLDLRAKWYSDFGSVMMPWVFECFESGASAQLCRMLMRVAVAIAWCDVENGAPPAMLEDLVPRYIESIPRCPYTGAALRYAAGRVWSIGGDGDDDGGKPLADEDDFKSDGDVVWTVKPRGR